ncbi:hypothetical protein U4Z62_23475, partial [Escherichia coli]|nr:hypothetical protein [Escherichia coli]
NMSVEGLFVHGGDLWRLNTPLSCLQPPQQGKTLLYTVVCSCQQINTDSGYQYLSLHRLLIFRSLILCSRGLLATASIQQKGKISPGLK